MAASISDGSFFKAKLRDVGDAVGRAEWVFALPKRAKRAISRPLPNGLACTIVLASPPLVGARVRPLPHGDTAPTV